MMVAHLLREEILFPPSQEVLTYKRIFEGRLPFQEHWMGVYLGNKKIGYLSSMTSPYRKEDISGLLLSHQASLSLPIRSEGCALNLQGYSLIDSNHLLREISFHLFSDLYHLTVKGERCGEDFILRIKGLEEEETVMLPKFQPISSPFIPIFSLPGLKENRTYTIDLFDPIKLETQKATLKIKERRKEYILAEISYQDHKTELEMNKRGEITKIITPFGLTFQREDEEEAKKIE